MLVDRRKTTVTDAATGKKSEKMNVLNSKAWEVMTVSHSPPR